LIGSVVIGNRNPDDASSRARRLPYPSSSLRPCRSVICMENLQYRIGICITCWSYRNQSVPLVFESTFPSLRTPSLHQEHVSPEGRFQTPSSQTTVFQCSNIQHVIRCTLILSLGLWLPASLPPTAGPTAWPRLPRPFCTSSLRKGRSHPCYTDDVRRLMRRACIEGN
jgi:hypothetical protein